MAVKSIPHITVSTLEDFRREVVQWHQARQADAESELQAHKRPSQAVLAALSREVRVHRLSALFWQEVHIDSPEPT